MARYDSSDNSWLEQEFDQTDDEYPPEEELPSDLGPEELLSSHVQDMVHRHRQVAIQRAQERERAWSARLQQAAADAAQRVAPVTLSKICRALEKLARSDDSHSTDCARRALALVAQLSMPVGSGQPETILKILRLLTDACMDSSGLRKAAFRDVHQMVVRYRAQLTSCR